MENPITNVNRGTPQIQSTELSSLQLFFTVNIVNTKQTPPNIIAPKIHRLIGGYNLLK